MAHFAELNKNNEVLQVIVVDNKNCLDKNGVESEAIGILFLQRVYGDAKRIFKQTSYNERIRKNFAASGHKWDEDRNAFITPKCDVGDWVLNEQTCKWIEVNPTKTIGIDSARSSSVVGPIIGSDGKEFKAHTEEQISAMPWYKRLWIKLCNFYHKLFSK